MLGGIIAYGKSPGEKKIDKYAKKMSWRRASLIYRKKAGRNIAFFLSVGEENAEMYFRKTQF
jgi:hypothetical protein